MEDCTDLNKIREYRMKIDGLRSKIYKMEQELEQLRECYKEHQQSIQCMENDIMTRVEILQRANGYVKQVKVFQQFQTLMLTYLQGNEVLSRVQDRRQTSGKMRQLIYDIENEISNEREKIRFYEGQITNYQYIGRKMGDFHGIY